jgi:hypothetical protein
MGHQREGGSVQAATQQSSKYRWSHAHALPLVREMPFTTIGERRPFRRCVLREPMGAQRCARKDYGD